jgi:hypothetical protein
MSDVALIVLGVVVIALIWKVGDILAIAVAKS